jgi:pimeloyl-ACP methyl ester carboxylesterase
MASIKDYILKIEKSIRIFFYFSVFDLSVGIVGMLFYAGFISFNGPVWIRNQYIGLWLMTLIVLTSIQSIHTELRQIKHRNIIFYIDLLFYVIITLLTLLQCIFFSISSKIDASIWSVYNCAVNLTNIYILILKTKQNNQSENNATTDENESFVNNCHQQTQRFKIISKKIINILIIIIKIFSLIITCFILSGSIVIGAGKLKYPARGKFIDIQLDDDDVSGRTLSIHYLCQGQINISEPVFIFESDASHGLADFLLIQELLTKNNRRSCIWDKPGLGYSDYLYTDMKNYSKIYSNFIQKLNESSKYIFVGWGGGGELIYEFTFKYPNMVKSLVFLDVYPNGIEFKVPFILNNWTHNQLEEYKLNELNRRNQLFNLINGIGVPWGLMNYFIPLPEIIYSNFVYESNWYFLTEKTWTTQSYFLPFVIKEQKNVFEEYKINNNITLNIISSFKTDKQIIENVCNKNNYANNSSKCLYEINSNRLYTYEKEKLVNLTNNGIIIRCELNECDQAYFIGIGVNFTVNNLLKL